MATLEASNVADNPENVDVAEKPNDVGFVKSDISPEVQEKHRVLITEKFPIATDEKLRIHHLWDIFYRVNVWNEKRIVRSWFVGIRNGKVTVGLTKGTSKNEQ